MPAKKKANPKSDAERAATYRKRVLQGENAPCTRLQTIISKRAKAHLESAAAKYGLSMRELLEELSAQAEQSAWQIYKGRTEREEKERERRKQKEECIARIDVELKRLHALYQKTASLPRLLYDKNQKFHAFLKQAPNREILQDLSLVNERMIKLRIFLPNWIIPLSDREKK
ncbi:hypothetical protein [Chitiniphilus eburneus]|uniref:hypothetical protein n=1 Tax=Chitiniphilus eburneus TaxID=2571148 RepID=UPI0035CF46A3